MEQEIINKILQFCEEKLKYYQDERIGSQECWNIMCVAKEDILSNI